MKKELKELEQGYKEVVSEITKLWSSGRYIDDTAGEAGRERDPRGWEIANRARELHLRLEKAMKILKEGE